MRWGGGECGWRKRRERVGSGPTAAEKRKKMRGVGSGPIVAKKGKKMRGGG